MNSCICLHVSVKYVAVLVILFHGGKSVGLIAWTHFYHSQISPLLHAAWCVILVIKSSAFHLARLRICPTDMHSNVYFSIRRLLHFWNLMSIWWKTFPVWLNMCELAVWLWGLQGSFGQTNLKQWLLSLVCCLSWWLRPAVRPCCAASWPPAQTPLWHLSRVCTWAARPCPKAHWQQAMCQPSWTLCPLVPECQPTSRWPSRPLMARSPSSALRTSTSWIRLRRKAWNCPTPAVLDLAPAALARCLRAALTRATRRSWMTTRWARDSASPASPMPPLMWPSRPTVRVSFEVAASRYRFLLSYVDFRWIFSLWLCNSGLKPSAYIAVWQPIKLCSLC